MRKGLVIMATSPLWIAALAGLAAVAVLSLGLFVLAGILDRVLPA